VDQRIARVEAGVDELRLVIQSLQQRLEALEARVGGMVPAGSQPATEEAALNAPEDADSEVTAKGPYDPIAILTLIGRLFLVLAGGFFLRAMTDTGVIALPIGLGLAFVYALAWLFMTDRTAGKGQVPSALFHALAAAMVAFPLLIEATTRFKVLTAVTSTLGITVVSAFMLVVAWRQRLYLVAWLAVAAAILTSFSLLIKTGVVAPYACFLIVFGLATLWLSYWRGWRGIPWPAAVAADVAVIGVTLRAFAPEHQDSPEVAMLLQSLLLGGYVASAVIRTLIRGERISYFEMVQTAAALLVGLGGAVFLTRTTGTIPVVLGVASLAVGLGCYAIDVRVMEKREDGVWNAYFYSSLALVLVLTGLTLVLAEPWPAIVFALVGALAAWLWSRGGRPFALLHSAAYLFIAGIVSGALAYCIGALALPVAGPWMLPGAAVPVLVVAAGLSGWLATLRQESDREWFESTLRFTIVLVFVTTAGGSIIGYLAPAVGGAGDGAVDAGVLATVRTSVLSIAALLLAWLGRRERLREWGWLVYPLLVAIGVKMVMRDFPLSRPATLFVAMALYGAALIVAPRLRRRKGKTAAGESG
jgi:hypothetical protein